SRYGTAGKWDAGEYDTYLFGRTHAMGETVRVEYDLTDADTLWFEHGVGAKRPDPSQFNNARFTMLHHGHVGYKMGATAEFTAHYLHSWTQEEDRSMAPRNEAVNVTVGETVIQLPQNRYTALNYPSTLVGLPDGKMWVAGVDARLELGAFGYFYAGYSHIGAENAVSVAPAIEVLHAFGGGQFNLGLTDNYFGPGCRGGGVDNRTPVSAPNAPAGGCSLGTGTVDTVLAQYDFSLTNFLQQSAGGQKFWGEGQDLKLALYGMFNKVGSDVAAFDGITKLKYGADLQFAVLPWLTVATRYDRLQPNSRIADQSFSILSPRLVFRSKWITREQISIQYSRYMYNQRTCEAGFSPAFNVATDKPYSPQQLNCVQPPAAPGSAESFGSHYQNQNVGVRGAPITGTVPDDPNNFRAAYRPDENVVKIEASMWW
ncbi:MAG TPA: hypothetical protein VER33_27105, partial [Polyangiaceae bacterium]|nr:hypothetical protein [Polyangiaceae bacterium]